MQIIIITTIQKEKGKSFFTTSFSLKIESYKPCYHYETFSL